MKICDFIPTGRENAIRRADLARLVNLPDRQVRQLIEEARKDGALIINEQDGSGYYQADDLGAMKRQYRANYSRAMSILRQNTRLRRRIKELEGRNG